MVQEWYILGLGPCHTQGHHTSHESHLPWPSPRRENTEVQYCFKNNVIKGRRALIAQCVKCGLTLWNDASKPSKLKPRLEMRHPTQAGKPVEYFKRKENGQIPFYCCLSSAIIERVTWRCNFQSRATSTNRGSGASAFPDWVLPEMEELCWKHDGQSNTWPNTYFSTETRLSHDSFKKGRCQRSMKWWSTLKPPTSQLCEIMETAEVKHWRTSETSTYRHNLTRLSAPFTADKSNDYVPDGPVEGNVDLLD